MIGLAISMSATGMVLSHKATAATGTASPQASTLADLSNSVEAEIHSDSVAEVSQPRLIQSTTTALKVPTVKSEFHEDESLEGAACWRADGTPIGIGGGLARKGVRFLPETRKA
jgi:hypothetical protein